MHTTQYPSVVIVFKVIKAIIVLVLLFTHSMNTRALSQDTLKAVGHLGGWMGYGIVQGNYAFIGLGNNFAVLDVSTPVIQQQASIFLPPGNEISTMDIGGRYAFLNYAGDTLHVFDISNPLFPVSVALYTPALLTSCTDIQSTGNRLYLSDANNGLIICDTTNINSSLNVLGMYGATPIWRFHALGNYVALLTNKTPFEIQLIDVSNPAAPTKLSSVSLTGRGMDIVMKGNYLYVTTNFDLRVYNISNPQAPALVKTINWTTFPGRMAIDGSFLYIENNGPSYSFTRLSIYDITNPASPIFAGETRDLSGLQSISIQGGNAYLAEGTRFEVFDVSNQQNPTFIKEFESPWDIKSFSIKDKQMVVGDADRMFLYDITSPEKPVLQNVIQQWSSNGRIVLDSNLLFTLDDTYNQTKLSIIDIANPSNPQLKSEYTPPAGRDIQEIKIRQQYVFIGLRSNTTKDGWLYVLNISNPSAPQKIGEVALPAQPKDLFVPDSGNFIYLPYQKSNASRGFVIIDITNPSTPLITKDQHLDVDPAAVWIEADTLIVVSNKTASTWELGIWNITSKTTPTLLNSTTGTGQAWEVEYRNGKIIASLPGGSIHVFKISPIMQSLVQVFVNKIFQTRDIATSSDGSTSYVSSGYGSYDKKYVSASQGIETMKWWPGGKEATLTLGGSGSSSIHCPQDSTRKYQIFGFTLTADEVSDWDLGAIKFTASGSGDDTADVKMVRLYQQNQKLSEGKYNSDNGVITLGINKHLAANQSMSFRVEYEIQDSVAITAGIKTYSLSTSMSFVVASPTSWPFSQKLPPTPFSGGPIYIAGILNTRTNQIFPTIQNAISASSTQDGDVIEVCPGTYKENILVNKSLTIRSKKGKDVTIIEAANPSKHAVDILSGNTIIDGFTIKSASGNTSAGVHINGNFQERIQLLNSSVTSNTYGVYDERQKILDALAIEDCKISGNNSDGVKSGSEVTANGIEVVNNQGWGLTVEKDLSIGDKANVKQNIIRRNNKGGTRCNGFTFNGVQLDVSENSGPGIAVRGDIYIYTVQANNNEGPGIFSLEGSITITGGTTVQNEISHNKGAGVWCNAIPVTQNFTKGNEISRIAAPLLSEIHIQTAVIINDNASWGAIAKQDVYVNIVNDLPTSDKRISEVKRNGLSSEYFEITEWNADDLKNEKLNSKTNPSTGGGLCSQRFNVYAQRVEVIENGGLGIFAGHNISLTVVRANKNKGTGICALDGIVWIYPDWNELTQICEVDDNLGSGIQSNKGTFIATSIQINNNASWGIKAGGHIELNFFESHLTADSRISNITGNGKASEFFDTEHSNDNDYPNNAKVKARPSIVAGGGVWSKNLTIWGRYLNVSDNGGPGLAAYYDIYLKNVFANTNRGHGIFSFQGGVVIDMTNPLSDDNRINGNLGYGILSGGIPGSYISRGGVHLATSTQIMDNASWGIESLGDVELNLFGSIIAPDKRTSLISGNGHAPYYYKVTEWSDNSLDQVTITRSKNFMDGGGIWSRRSRVTGHYVDVSNNNGPGIAANQNIDLRGIRVVNNQGPGIFSLNGKVLTYPVSENNYPIDEVSGNKGFGIWAGGTGLNKDIYLNNSGVFLGHPITISRNAAWGIGALDDVEIGYYDGHANADSRMNNITDNGKSPIWYSIKWESQGPEEVMDRIKMPFKEKENGGAYSKQKGLRGRNLSIRNNGGDGVRAPKEIRLQNFVLTNNNENGIHTLETVNAQSGSITFNKGWGVIASAVDSLPLVTVENNVLGGIKLGRGTMIRSDKQDDFLSNESGKNLFIDQNAIAVTSSNIISSLQLSENGGDGLLDEIGTGITLHKANIFLNSDYGIRNTSATLLDAKNCWWGSNDGPSGIGNGKGDEVSTKVDYSPWLIKKTLLAITPLEDTLFSKRGSIDSAFVFARQFNNQIDDLNFTVSDSLNWLIGNPSINKNNFDAGAAVVILNYQIPGSISDGTINKIRVSAVSKSDPTAKDEKTIYVIAYSPSIARIIIQPDTVRLFPGAGLYFNVKAFDQHGYSYPIVEKWSSNGGTFDSTNRFIAGSSTGTFNVTVRDSASGAQSSAVVIIEASKLMRVVMHNHFIKRSSNLPLNIYASGVDQFGMKIPFTAQWNSTRGTVDSTFVITDSTASITIVGSTVSTPIDTTSFLVIVRDSSSNLADTAVVYSPLMKLIAIRPDTIVTPPNTTVWFSAIGYDQYLNVFPISANWSATGGAIDSLGKYIAGNSEGTFKVTVEGMNTQLQADAIVLIEKPHLALLFTENDTLRLSPNTKAALTAYAIDQFGNAFPFTPDWNASAGKIENQNSYIDSLIGFVMTAEYTSPNMTGQFKIILRDPTSGKADTVVIIVQGTVAVKNIPVPKDIILYQNYPNPFSERTTITLTPYSPLPKSGEGSGERVSLKIFDLLGREVLDLTSELINNRELRTENGERKNFELTIDNFQLPKPGIYFYRLITPTFAQTKAMIYIK